MYYMYIYIYIYIYIKQKISLICCISSIVLNMINIYI